MVERIRSVTNFVMDCGHRWFDIRFGVSELTYYNTPLPTCHGTYAKLRTHHHIKIDLTN